MIGGGDEESVREEKEEEHEPRIVGNVKEIVLVRKSGLNKIVCQMDYPSEGMLFECFHDGCKTRSQGGFGADDLKYLTRHFTSKHKQSVQWMYRCSICGEKSGSETGTVATRWVVPHMKKHKIEAVPNFKMSQSAGSKVKNALNDTATSFSFTRKKATPKKKAETPVKMLSTPEKRKELESRPNQTRSVTKALTESVRKMQKAAEENQKKKDGLASIFQKAKPRKSLSVVMATIQEKSESPTTSFGAKDAEIDAIDADTLSRSERVAWARKMSANQGRRSANRRLSLVGIKSPKIDESVTGSTKKSANSSQISVVDEAGEPEKRQNKEISKNSLEKNKISDGETEKENLLVFYPDYTTKRINTWCLDNETGKDAWFSDEIIQWYLDCLTSENENYKILSPVYWLMWKKHGMRESFIRENLMRSKTYFFPVCENNHWILLVISHKEIWYANNLGREPEGNVEKFMNELNRERRYFEIPVPLQKDGWNCGVHVCLMAKSIAEGSYWYSEEDVQSFRAKAKRKLEMQKINLFSEEYREQIAPPTQKCDESDGEIEIIDEISAEKVENESKIDEIFAEKVENESKIDETPEISVCEKTFTVFKGEVPPSEDREFSFENFETEKAEEMEIPALMELNIETPPKEKSVRENKREKPKKQMGKEKKVPTGKPDELSQKVKIWFDKEFESYVRDGRSFQRLEWIADVLTASIKKASAGDGFAIEKIAKRNPPLEIEEGEMCTQTDTKKKYPAKKANKADDSSDFSGSFRDSYWQNRAKTFNRIIGKESKQCEIPIDKLEEFFRKTTSVTNVPKEVLEEKTARLPKAEIGEWIEKEFTEKEIEIALKKTKDTAPGVDGLRYYHLSWFDPDHRILALLYNECRKHRRIPEHWKEAETILLYKGGDEGKPENWRPISLMPTIYKLYSSLWNRRIRSVQGIMSKCQRGFQEREGCNESIGILRTAIDVAKGRKNNLSVAWLDLTNAFGSVPHELIEQTLIANGFPEMVVQVIKDMYKGAAIRVKSKNEKSERIQIKSGVKQGDPISPTLFNMCLESVIRGHLKSAAGHKCLKTKVKILAFADDMAILSESKSQLQRELEKMDEDCTPLNLIFKPAKCASLIIEGGKVKPKAELLLKGQPIRNLGDQDTYKYLGVQTGIETRVSEMSLIKSVTNELDMVNKCELTQPQKLDCVKTFVLPKMTYMYANSIPRLTELREFANITMRAVKVMHGIPVAGSPLEYIQLPTGKGGLGVACPKTTAMITYLVSTMKKLWSDDEYIRKLYSEYLKEVTKMETGNENVTLSDIAAFLSDEVPVDKKAFGFNGFTRIREVCKGLSKIKNAPLHKIKIVEENGKLAILVQAVKDGKEKIFSAPQVKKLQKLLKDEVNAALLHRFTTEKVVKSAVVRVIQQYPKCNSFVRKGGKVSLAAHRFVHKARLNLLACNYNTFDKSKSKACRRCDYENETQWHIMQSCKFGLPKKITERHDAVLHKVKSLIEKGAKKDWEMKIDEELPGCTRLRPDIVLKSPDGKEIILADVTIPYENGISAMERGWDSKIEKYEEGFQHLKNQGIKLTVLPIVIGALGTWWKPTSGSLTELGIDRRVVEQIIPELCSTVLEYSKNIYWNHIFGDSYNNIPLKFGVEKPKGNYWKKERDKKSLEISDN